MPLIIDGYNLLYAAGLVSSIHGDGSFEADRVALLNALLSVIEPSELRQTVVVFDSAKAPPGLPRVFNYGEITVRFASGYTDADEMIEELIRDHHAPRRLTVVSSDHRVQRAAKRRKAKAIDSDSWFRLMRQTRTRRQQQEAQKPPPAKRPAAAVPSSDVAQWLKFFGDIDVDSLAPTEKRLSSLATKSPASSPGAGPSSKSPVEPEPPQNSRAPSEDEPRPSNVFSDDYLRGIAEEFFGDESE